MSSLTHFLPSQLVLREISSGDVLLGNCSLGKRKLFVWDYAIDRNGLHFTKSCAMRTRARGIIKGEHTRFKLTKRNAVLFASVILREFQFLGFPLARNGDDRDVSIGSTECVFDRVGKSGCNALSHNKTVDNDIDAMFFIFVKLDLFGKIVHISIDTHADVSALARVGKDFFVKNYENTDSHL